MRGVVLFDQNSNGSKQDKGEERLSQFVIASGNTAEMLELIKETLHQMALFVNPPITIPRIRIVCFGRDAVIPAALQNIFSDFRGTIRFISKHDAFHDFHMVKDICGYLRIMHISRRKLQIQRVA
jgi:hypothetical protein